MHLFLYGPSGAGKSTLIRQALQARGLTPPGLKTVKLPLTGGRQAEPADRINANQSHPAEWAGATDLVFLTSAGYCGTHQELGPESLIGYCGKRGILAAAPKYLKALARGCSRIFRLAPWFCWMSWAFWKTTLPAFRRRLRGYWMAPTASSG